MPTPKTATNTARKVFTGFFTTAAELDDGCSVGDIGWDVGLHEVRDDGLLDGCIEGWLVGCIDGTDDGCDDGSDDGCDDGSDDGCDDGCDDGSDDGCDDGFCGKTTIDV